MTIIDKAVSINRTSIEEAQRRHFKEVEETKAHAQAVELNRKVIEQAQEQHRKAIDDAHKRLEALINKAEQDAMPETQVNDLPQSLWLEGNDGERFLMLNESAAHVITALFQQFNDVVQLIADQEKRVR